MNTHHNDMTLPPDLTRKHGSGPVRQKYPIYFNSLPPCNAACPTGSNIQAWLALTQNGFYEAAFQELVKNNPMPAIHGRVCYHPCETFCNRAEVDGAVSIHAVERFLGDEALKKSWMIPNCAPLTHKRVLIIGAGPCGLATAYYLRLAGHDVEIHENGPMAGGMMRFGIPAYRLPRSILEGEIRRIENLGVKIVLNTRVDNILVSKKTGKFDAVFIAIGAHLSNGVDIRSDDTGKVFDAISYLRAIGLKRPLNIGKRVVIYGGGNAAMDAARTARRMGCDVTVVYRRDRAHMPAHDFECAEAVDEGVRFRWLRSIEEINGTLFTLDKMVLDAQGRAKPTGEKETLEADSLILAVGQRNDTDLTKNIPQIQHKEDGTVAINDQMMTGLEGIFAGGDMVPSERTVTTAVGHGRKAAKYIDAFLRDTTYHKDPKKPLVRYNQLHLWYRTDAEKIEQAMLDKARRLTSFDEILASLTEKEASFEASRCYSCGNCFECDGCFGACPQDAIIRLGKGKGYEVNYARCTGCEACVLQCPCHAMEMVSGNPRIKDE